MGYEFYDIGSTYQCCPADQAEGHKDSCGNEGLNPRIFCGESIPAGKPEKEMVDISAILVR